MIKPARCRSGAFMPSRVPAAIVGPAPTTASPRGRGSYIPRMHGALAEIVPVGAAPRRDQPAAPLCPSGARRDQLRMPPRAQTRHAGPIIRRARHTARQKQNQKRNREEAMQQLNELTIAIVGLGYVGLPLA